MSKVNSSVVQGTVFSSTEAYKALLFEKQYLLFDKIINVRFIRQDQSTSFTIRSDYEPIFHDDGSYSFIKCRMKPEIRLEYRRVTTEIGISIKLYVTNLHILSAQYLGSRGNVEFFNYDKNPITRIIIQYGYFHQFPDFTDTTLNYTMQDFLELRDLASNPLYQTLDCQVLAVYPISNPPDGRTLFDCIVGNTVDVFHKKPEATDSLLFDTKEADIIKTYFFENITKVYLRKGWYAPDAMQLISAESGMFNAVSNGNNIQKKVTGRMTKYTAERYGVLCYITKNAETNIFRDSDGKLPKYLPTLPLYSNLFQTLNYIKELSPNISFMQLPDGNLLIFHVSDTPDDVYSTLKTVYGKILNFQDTIPAVISITYAGLRTIVTPVYTRVFPFMKVAFTSEYNLANLIGFFYYPRKGEEVFYIIGFEVLFDTTGDTNEMSLLTTDSSANTSTTT